MSHLDILIPFGLPQPAMAADLIRALQTPALATLLAHAKQLPAQSFDAFSHTLPHERWLARQCGLPDHVTGSNSPPVSVACMRKLGLQADDGVWFMLQPVHIHVARDHLVLGDGRQLDISDAESRTLFALAQPLCAEAGKSLLYGDARHWFLRADDWSRLQTSTPDAACGHNVDIWMPKIANAETSPGKNTVAGRVADNTTRAWRKLQNEVQMHWHAHVINEAREERGAKPINSVWLWGGASTTLQHGESSVKEIFNLHGWMDALGQSSAITYAEDCNASDILKIYPDQGLLVLDNLIAPSLSGELSDWLDQMQQLETDWLAPMLTALQSGKLQRLNLILSDNTRLLEFSLSKNSLRKFWVKPSLNRLLP